MSTPTVTALATSVAAALLVVGCAADVDTAPDGASARKTSSQVRASAPPSTNASPPAPEVPPFPQGTARQLGKGSGRTLLVLVDVRVHEHQGYDRLVLRFSGSGTPGWVVNYVDRPRLEGSGKTVSLDGGAALDIYASGTTWPAPDYYDGPRRLRTEAGEALDEVYVAGTFEGYTQVLAGVDGDRVPFRVTTREAPSRLVVDVRDRVD